MNEDSSAKKTAVSGRFRLHLYTSAGLPGREGRPRERTTSGARARRSPAVSADGSCSDEAPEGAVLVIAAGLISPSDATSGRDFSGSTSTPSFTFGYGR